MKENAKICSICWNQSGCDEELSPQLITRSRDVRRIDEDNIRYGQSACRHFTCTAGGVLGALNALDTGKSETINTSDGSMEATTFESEDKKTKGLRWIAKNGQIYSSEEEGEVFRQTGQILDRHGRFRY